MTSIKNTRQDNLVTRPFKWDKVIFSMRQRCGAVHDSPSATVGASSRSWLELWWSRGGGWSCCTRFLVEPERRAASRLCRGFPSPAEAPVPADVLSCSDDPSMLGAGRPCRRHRRGGTSERLMCWGCVTWRDGPAEGAPLPLRDSCFESLKNDPLSDVCTWTQWTGGNHRGAHRLKTRRPQLNLPLPAFDWQAQRI